MRDIQTFLNEEEFASTPQSMPNIGAIENGDISDTTASVLTSKTGTDIPSNLKDDDEDDASENSLNDQDELEQKYGITHPLYDVLVD